MADVGVSSDIGHDEHRPAAFGDDLIRQFGGHGNVVLGLAENDEIEGARDRRETVYDLVVAAAIEVDEGGAVVERRGRGRERRPRGFHRCRIMRAGPGRDRPDLMGVRLFRKQPRQPRPSPFGDA